MTTIICLFIGNSEFKITIPIVHVYNLTKDYDAFLVETFIVATIYYFFISVLQPLFVFGKC